MHILHVVGARPNFMKAAPVMRALAACERVRQTLVHTGQHYDFNMSGVFFQELGIRQPDINLEVGSASHTRQTAETMLRLESVLLERKPDWVLVYGDVNSTLAAALVCAKLSIRMGHVEAGLRSFDRAMPEEINRVLTDHVADLLFTPSEDGDYNLEREGIAPEKIHRVGNVMIDTLVQMLPLAQARWTKHFSKDYAHTPYILVTLHRPSNVDRPSVLKTIVEQLLDLGKRVTVIFPAHPRTRKALQEVGLDRAQSGLHLVEPLSYIEFLALQSHALGVVTDSGGIQEETTFLGIPCLTLRENTERPITVTVGTNSLVGNNLPVLHSELEKILRGQAKHGQVPPLWDGHAAERIAALMVREE